TSAGMIRSRIAQAKAERQAARANAVSEFMESMLKSARPSASRRAEDIRVVDIVRTAADSVERKFNNQPEADAQIRGTLGATYLALGSNNEALKQLKRAYDVACANDGEESDQALRITPDLIYVTAALGHPHEAESLARKCYEIARRKLGDNNALTEQLESSI